MGKIIYGFFYLVSLLPLWILYGIGDFIYVLVLTSGYRKKVVWNNLKTAFPEKADAELKKISRKFYRNFVHTFIETIKFTSISEKQLAKMGVSDFTVINELNKKYPRITCLTGHFMNWEFHALYPIQYMPCVFLGVYMGISNKAFDQILYKIRTRFGSILLRAGHISKEMLPWRDKEYIMGLMADQNPANPKGAVWMYFFGKPTPFVKGPEAFTRLGKTPVFFSWLVKKGLGKYEFNIELICEDPSTLPPNEIQKIYVRKLEEKIRQNPDNYLWTHKRWKFDWQPEYAKLWVDDVPAPRH